KRCPFPLASLCPRRVPRRPSLTRDSERIALSDKHGQAQQEHQAQVHPPERHAPRDRRGREGQVPLARGAQGSGREGEGCLRQALRHQQEEHPELGTRIA
ncbi:hypothetical protein Ctob_007166, partial [Chrysochromulina tobinii]